MSTVRQTRSYLVCPCCDAGAASRSFTSTAQDVVTKNHRVTERIERCPKKKAYLRLSTTHGARLLREGW